MFIAPVPPRPPIHSKPVSRPSQPLQAQAMPAIRFGMQGESSHTAAARRYQRLQEEIQEDADTDPESTILPANLKMALAYPEDASDDEPPLLILLPSEQNIHPSQVKATYTPFASEPAQSIAAQNENAPESPNYRRDIIRTIGGLAMTAVGAPLAIFGYGRTEQNPLYSVLGTFGQIICMVGAMVGGVSGIRTLWNLFGQDREPRRLDQGENV